MLVWLMFDVDVVKEGTGELLPNGSKDDDVAGLFWEGR